MVFDLLYKKGEHEGRAIWLRCGVLIEKENGKMSVKLDTVPVSGEWDGWLVVSERRDMAHGRPGNWAKSNEAPGREEVAAARDDDLPF